MKCLAMISICGALVGATPAFAACAPGDYYCQDLRALGNSRLNGDDYGVSSRPNPAGGYDYSNGISSRRNPLGGYDYSNGVTCRPNPLGGMDCR